LNRFWILAGAVAVSLAALALAFVLGSASFDFRRYAQHEGRLRKVLREAPTAELLTRALQDEGAPLVAAALSREQAERAIAAHGGRKSGEIRGKAARYPQLRVFRATDMLYFVYFDAEGVMRDFTCVGG
jgi:hypothetical protein